MLTLAKAETQTKKPVDVLRTFGGSSSAACSGERGDTEEYICRLLPMGKG